MLKGVTHVYTDLDGTLFAPGGRLLAAHDGSPSIATAQALVALKEAGIEVIVVTGRNRAQGNEIMRLLNLQTFIGEFGCVVQEGFGARAQTIYALGDWERCGLANGLASGLASGLVDPLAPDELPLNTTPAELIIGSGVIERLIAAAPGKLEPHNPYEVTREVTLMLRGYIDAELAGRVLNECPLPLQLLDNGIIYPLTHTLVDCPEIHIYHILPRGAGKGATVAADMARRGLTRAQTVSIGDAVGDMEMGEHTGSFVLVNGGAVEKVVDGYPHYHIGDLATALSSIPASHAASTTPGSGFGESGSGFGEPGSGFDDSGSGFGLPDSDFSKPDSSLVVPNANFGALFITQGKTADGWAEFAHALLAAQAKE